ncbi:PhzF family phenazine biosynthesis protein [Helicobacter sp. MIT 14-3879]|uniref:PhzF family phenazine biosynthesis protein n=1 Tax=Helicobacter sp. MIT 14-3879 TaxID=2040649 RepID=UPI000E1E76A3|nr:PhzF family phenazine biosynthesis protein [Helicobacter sp. MIT 14-3879]RDU65490.1 hypothetical protein CQA44_00410 [Helicobacter sp. MIT 14-3879]
MKCYVVDAFSNKIFSGNPAAICILEGKWLDDNLMQNIAREHNLSETAFILKESENVSPQKDSLNDRCLDNAPYLLRWFTPAKEIDLCGHATLASAFVVMNILNPNLKNVEFHTRSGLLKVNKRDSIYSMDFPSFPLRPVEVDAAMSEAIGYTPLEAYMGRDLVCVLDSAQAVREAKPHTQRIESLKGELLHITARGEEYVEDKEYARRKESEKYVKGEKYAKSEKYDCISRSFAPKHGINEDPVCGSGHCHLVPLWKRKLNKDKILAYQASSRGGILHCECKDDRVILGGEAVLYSVNEICL